MNALNIVRALLDEAVLPAEHSIIAYQMLDEHCGHCETSTKVTLKPQNVDLSKIPAKEKQMGTKVEKEHVRSAKDALAIAAGHWSEDPHYYQKGKKRGVFPELAKTYMTGDSFNVVGGILP